MGRRLLIGGAGLLALAVAALVVVAGLRAVLPGPSPRSTVAGPSGTPVVVDWKDYPGHADNEGDDLIGEPDQAELEAPARALLSRIAAAVERSTGAEMTAVQRSADWFADENWYPEGGNGYGGESMLTTVNCCELRTTQVPPRARWRSVMEAVSDVTEDAGMGRIAVDYDARGRSTDPELSEDYREQYCNLPGGGCWTWTGWRSDGHQWVDIAIEDGTLDPTGAAAREAKESGRPIASVSISYGATVVRAGRGAAYERALAPFRGLAMPEATTSD